MGTSAAIYVRRSALDDREGDNRSLGAQERECRAWAESEGLDVGPVYREAVGTSASRFSKKSRPPMSWPHSSCSCAWSATRRPVTRSRGAWIY